MTPTWQKTFGAPVLRWLSLLGFGLVMVVITGSADHRSFVAEAQGVPPSNTYHATSPHWSHIDLADFGRKVKYLNQTDGTYTAVLNWYAAHVDMVEVGMNSFISNYDYFHNEQHIKSINPTTKTFGYEYDATVCLHQGCGRTQPTMPADRQPSNEDAYLHFSEATTIEYFDLQGNSLGTETFPGCPVGQPMTPDCRVKVFIWEDYRWVIYQANTAWQTWYADHLLTELATDPYNSPYLVDGLFLDEHGPGFSVTMGFGAQTKVSVGGGIREYSGLRPKTPPVSAEPDALDMAYMTDAVQWLSYLEGRLSTVDTFMLLNLAEYFSVSTAVQTGVAAKGAMTELLNSPLSNAQASAANFQAFLDATKSVTDVGGIVELADTPCGATASVITGKAPTFSAGNFDSLTSRFKMWQLASYYLVKPTNTGRVYLDLNLCLPDTVTVSDLDQQWMNAYMTDVGQPTDATTITASGANTCSTTYSIFTRHYSNATIMLRPRDSWWCNTYNDATAVTVPLGQTMAILQADGTLSAPITSVTLRNAEAVILIPVDATAPGTVMNLQAG